jgi:hypothetical protein
MRRALPAVLVLGVLVALPWVVLGTQSGARRLADYLALQTGLDLRYSGGTLWSGIQLERLAFESDEVALDARSVSITPDWDWRCILRSTVCLRAVDAASVSIRLSESGAGSDPEFRLPERIELPLGLSINSFAIAELNYSQGPSSESLRDIRVELAADRAGLELKSFSFVRDTLELAGRGRLGWAGGWPLRARLTAVLSPPTLPEQLPGRWQLTAQGSLQEISLEVSTPDQPKLGISLELALEDDFRSLRAEAEVRGLDSLPVVAGLSPWLQLQGPVSTDFTLESGRIGMILRTRIDGYAETPLALHTQLSLSGASWHLDELSLTDDRSRQRLLLDGDLGVPGDWQLDLALQVRDLSLPTAAGVPITGLSGSAAVRLALTPSTPSWELDALDLTAMYEDEPLEIRGALASAPDHLLLPYGTLAGSVRDVPVIYERQRDEAGLTVALPEGWEERAFKLRSISAWIEPSDRTQIRLSVDGDISSELTLSLEETDGGAVWRLEPFEARGYGELLTSEETMTGSWQRDASAFLVDPFCWRLRTSSACSDAMVLGQTGSIDVLLEGEESFDGVINENPYNVFVYGSGTLHADWAEGVFGSAQLALRLPVLGVDPYLGVGTRAATRFEDVSVELSATAEEQRFFFDAGSERMGTLTARVTRDAQGLHGGLTLKSLSLPAFDDLLPELNLNAGTLSGNLQVAGTLEAPRLRAEIELLDGTVSLPGEVMPIEEARLYIGGSLDEFTVRGSAMLGGGPLQIDGRCCDADQLTLELTGERNQLQLPMGLDVAVTPELKAVVDMQRAQLTGTITVHRGLLQLSGPVGDGVRVSKDVVRVDAVLEQPRRLALAADVRTIIEPGFAIRSAQLEATLGGDLRLLAESGSPPQLFGSLQVLGGFLRAYGQALRLDRGSIAFVGDPLNPDLNLTALKDIRAQQLRVGVRATGTLEAPQLTLFSDPARSDSETLSYLLRGRPPDAGAGADGTAMAIALGASAVTESGLLDSLNSVPGLSGVTLGAEGSENETAATISAYVGERLYLSYGVGIYEPIDGLTARLYLRSRLWVEVVSRLENSLDLYYHFDLD